jgi:RHS repeat-associated protein
VIQKKGSAHKDRSSYHDSCGNRGQVSFGYDSLSRLTSASNPESGTVSYTYDANGNVITKTDARNITTCFGDWNGTSCNGSTGYDALNRNLKKTYSDGVTPAAHFVYDTSPQLSVTLPHPIGRLVEGYTDASNGTVYGYDYMGRVSVNNQAPPTVWGSTTFAETYNYDYLGDVTSSLNGEDLTPFTLTYSYNRAGRLTGITSSLSDSNHPGTLLSGAHYNAIGSLSSETLDGGIINESRTYDSRLRLNGITDTAISTTFYSLSVPTNGYAPDSNLLAYTDSFTLQGFNYPNPWAYGYDDFNRLCAANQSATQPTCGQSATYMYAYDRFGNRWQQNGPTSMMLTFSGNNNRIDAASGASYDAAGNVTRYQPPTGDTFSYAYDAENRLTSVTDQTTGNQTCYTYDANGHRVERTYNCGTSNHFSRDFLYDLEGHQISQVEGSNLWDRGDVYAGERLLATYVWDGTMYFNYPDRLGSARVRTDITGSIYETSSNLPFGELTYSGGDPSPMHFTGQEHDFESGLDNFKARYLTSSFGRFMTPDPSGGHLSNPQSLNRYAYAYNNPITLVDPTGLDAELHDDRSCDPGFCDSWLAQGSAARLAAWTNGGGAGGFGAPGTPGNDLVTAADNWSPFGFQYIDDNGAAYPGLFNSWDEYATWSTGIAAKLQWEDDIGGQFNNVTEGLFKNFGPGPQAYFDLDNPRIVGSHANFVLDCDSNPRCQPGRFDYGIHIECAGYDCTQLVVHGDTVSPWISPFRLPNLNLGNFLEHGTIDLIGGTLLSPFGFVFPH